MKKRTQGVLRTTTPPRRPRRIGVAAQVRARRVCFLFRAHSAEAVYHSVKRPRMYRVLALQICCLFYSGSAANELFLLFFLAMHVFFTSFGATHRPSLRRGGEMFCVSTARAVSGTTLNYCFVDLTEMY